MGISQKKIIWILVRRYVCGCWSEGNIFRNSSEEAYFGIGQKRGILVLSEETYFEVVRRNVLGNWSEETYLEICQKNSYLCIGQKNRISVLVRRNVFVYWSEETCLGILQKKGNSELVRRYVFGN